jgi:hypothetical protein
MEAQMNWALFGYNKDNPLGEFIAEARTKEELKEAETRALQQGYTVQYVHADGSKPNFIKAITV